MADDPDAALRESMIHGLRSQGWSRIDAETEADDRIETIRARRKADQAKGEG